MSFLSHYFFALGSAIVVASDGNVDAIEWLFNGKACKIIVACFDGLACHLCIVNCALLVVGWHKHHKPQRGNVGLVSNHFLDADAILHLHIPCVALGIDGVGRVVVEVIECAPIAIVFKHIITGIVVACGRVARFSHVHIDVVAFEPNGSDAPQVVLDVVAGDDDVVAGTRVAHTDATASQHGIGDVGVVGNDVVFNHGTLQTQCGDAIAVVGDDVVLDECEMIAGLAQHVAHSDASHLVKG